MKTIKMLTILIMVLVLILSWPEVSEAAPIGTAFTYQGHLYDANYAANDSYDFAFKLYDANAGGNKVGTDVNLADVDVIDAYFTVELDFGVGVFDGDKRWLEVGIRPGEQSDPCGYTTLEPRQEVTPTPYAIYAVTAGSSPGSITGSGTNNYLAKFTGGTTLGNSIIYEKNQSDGRLGIGLTNAKADLHIHYPGAAVRLTNDNTGADWDDGIQLSYWTGGSLNAVLWNRENGFLSLGTNNTERMRIASNGNVGIGTGSPEGKLHAVTGSSSGLGGYAVFQSSSSVGYRGGALLTNSIASSGTSFKMTSSYNFSGNGIGRFGYVDNDDTETFVSGPAVEFQYDGDVILVQDAGNVGIGTTSPGAELEVNGQVKITGGSPGAGKVLTSNAAGLASWQTPATGGDITAVYADNGLTGGATSGDAHLNVGAGDGIDVSTNTVAVDVTDFAGNGLGESSNDLKVNTSTGLEISSDAVRLTSAYSSGSAYDSRFVNEGQANSITTGMIASDTIVYGTTSNAPAFTGEGSGSAYGLKGSSDLNYGVWGVTGGSGAWSWAIHGQATSGGVGGYFSSQSGYGLIVAKGNVGIGTTSPAEQLTVRGNLLVERSDGTDIIELGEGLDYAEGFDVSDKADIASGTVLVIDAQNPGKLAISDKAYDSKVAGIVAGAKGLGSGVRLGPEQFDYDVALAGRVYCNVDATQTAVEVGDLLTTSDTPGYAMKAADYMRAHGAVLGKAMERLQQGQKGQILVLVTLQ